MKEALERLFFPKMVRAKDFQRAHDAAGEGAMGYLMQLPPLPLVDTVKLDESLGSVIQVYKANGASKYVLIIPGHNSYGQGPKYDWLISDLIRHRVSTARINNTHRIALDFEQFAKRSEYYTAIQTSYKQYMLFHLSLVAAFLAKQGFLAPDKEFHLIASSAGAASALAMHELFKPAPTSLILVGPSADIGYSDEYKGIDSFLAGGGRIQVIMGENDRFRKMEPFLSLRMLSRESQSVQISEIMGADHDLRQNGVDRGTLQLGFHRECFRSLGLPHEQFDQICGAYPYIRQL